MTASLMPAVVAHRGASATAPENTVAALRAAVAAGAEWAEIDARLAGCGGLVVMHDARLERTTNGHGAVRHFAARDVARLDAGGWFASTFAGELVPMLADALAAAGDLGLGLNVEVKAEGDDEARSAGVAAAAILLSWPGPFVLSSFARPALTAARERACDAPLGLLVGRTIAADDLAFAREVRAVALHADRRAFDRASLERIVRQALWPVAYTVNDAPTAVQLWRSGVRTVITDRPGALLAARPGGG